METIWLFETLAVSVECIDFLDPPLASEPNTRERGVRVELRTVDSERYGSIYVSSHVTLHPAVCRIDLLESAPNAADRMHWHPTMPAGEPGDRTFDGAIPADPLGWLSARLGNVLDLLSSADVQNAEGHTASAQQITQHKDEIVAAARLGLEWARQPWPDVSHDYRGMATAL